MGTKSPQICQARNPMLTSKGQARLNKLQGHLSCRSADSCATPGPETAAATILEAFQQGAVALALTRTAMTLRRTLR
jgi:hypothetical protein